MRGIFIKLWIVALATGCAQAHEPTPKLLTDLKGGSVEDLTAAAWVLADRMDPISAALSDSSLEEARIAIALGASASGLVSQMPSGPGVIDESLIAQIAGAIPPAISSFLLTCETKVDRIAAQQRRCRVNTLQLCDRLAIADYGRLRDMLPGITLVQVIHVTGEDVIADALTIAPHVNGLLLDSGAPTAQVRELGGTGRTHNWEISRRIVAAVPAPVFLAGGLNSSNVRDAREMVSPFGVDVCSGVRADGVLDPEKLEHFMMSATGTA